MMTHYLDLHTEHGAEERCRELGDALARNREFDGPFLPLPSHHCHGVLWLFFESHGTLTAAASRWPFRVLVEADALSEDRRGDHRQCHCGAETRLGASVVEEPEPRGRRVSWEPQQVVEARHLGRGLDRVTGRVRSGSGRGLASPEALVSHYLPLL